MFARSWKFVKENKLLCILVISAVALIVPLLALCFYASPAADDFSHAYKIADLLPDNYGLVTYFWTVFKYSLTIYTEIQGAFTINSLIALNPMVYSMSLMSIFYLLNFGIFIIANYTLSDVLARKVLKSDRKMSFMITGVMLIMSLQFIPLAESFYWYAGIVAYTLPYSLALLYVSNLISMFSSKRIGRPTTVGIILGLALGGTNFAIGLFLSVVMTVVSAGSIFYRSRVVRSIVAMNAAVLTGFLINVFSAGNGIRATWLEALGVHKLPPVRSIVLSFWESGTNMVHIIGSTMLIFFAVLLLLKIGPLMKGLSYKFRAPLMLTLLSVGLASAYYVPAIYSGVVLDTRYSNIATMVMIWLILTNIFYWVGWALKHDKIEFSIKRNSAILILLAVVSLQQPLSVYDLENFSSVVTAKDIATGEAGRYRDETSRMYKTLGSLDGIDVTYNLYSQPASLKKIIISDDCNYWENRSLAQFFGLKSIKSDPQ